MHNFFYEKGSGCVAQTTEKPTVCQKKHNLPKNRKNEFLVKQLTALLETYP